MDNDEIYGQLINEALRFVSLRPRSVFELNTYISQRIKKKGITDAGLLPRILKRLEELGYADDEKFTRWLIKARQGRSAKGLIAIKQELKQKGIEKATINQCLQNFSEVENDEGNIESDFDVGKKLAAGKLRVWASLPPLECKRKLYTLLLRRGFGFETAGRVIDEFFQKSYNTR